MVGLAIRKEDPPQMEKRNGNNNGSEQDVKRTAITAVFQPSEKERAQEYSRQASSKEEAEDPKVYLIPKRVHRHGRDFDDGAERKSRPDCRCRIDSEQQNQQRGGHTASAHSGERNHQCDRETEGDLHSVGLG